MAEKEPDDLLARLRKDEKSAMKILFQQNYGLVCGVINRLVRNKATSEDIAQEVFIKFWNKRKEIQITSSLSAYLKRMAVNEAISHFRKIKNIKTTSDEVNDYDLTDQADIELELIGKETKAKITRAIDKLPPQCRLIFRLSRYEELSYKEIAAKLGLSIKTVENQISKALKILRVELKEHLTIALLTCNIMADQLQLLVELIFF